MGSFYRSKHELVFVFKSGTAPHINNFELGQHGRYRTNVWDYAGVNTMRAGRLRRAAPCTRRSSRSRWSPTRSRIARSAGGIVLDPFCGSGTILIAAERTGRRCHALEIDPGYVDVAIRRWAKFTGKDAVLAGTIKTFAEVEAERRAHRCKRQRHKC